MIESLLLYKWALIGGTLAGAALSLIGAQLAARNQSVQSLVVSQAASFGVTVALAFRTGGDDPHSHVNDVLPLIGGSAAALVFYFLCELVVRKRWPSRNTHFVVLFSLLMAMGYTLVSLVPTMESHMSAAYFGDLSVATNHETMLIALLAFLSLLFLVTFWKRISYWSFEQITFGQFLASQADRRIHLAFLSAGMVMVSASVHFLGLLFTLACLFIPVVVITKSQLGLKRLAAKLIIATFVGVLGGFALSLGAGNLPTVPVIALTLVVTSLVTSKIPF